MPEHESKHVLLVEDDRKLARVVQEYLEVNGFSVTIEERGDLVAERVAALSPDLVILDIMLPGKDGLTICRELRPGYAKPILMLTARGDEIDEILGLEVGADDYMTKPVQPRLLLSRLQALLRRDAWRAGTSGESGKAEDAADPQRIQLATLTVDAANRQVRLRDAPVELTTAEFDLLWLLARHAGEILTREQIYTEVRGIAYDGLDRSIDLRVTRLRRKLGDDGKQPQLIKSIRGVGYLLAKNS